MKPEDEARLRDILEAALRIRAYTAGGTLERFNVDVRTQDAVIRRFEIMGEAAAHISDEARARFPSVPFREIRAMRNVLAHEYGEIHLDRVWATIERDLPSVIAALATLFPTLTIQTEEPKS